VTEVFGHSILKMHRVNALESLSICGGYGRKKLALLSDLIAILRGAML
jgi:hypothetical protein